MDRNWKGILEGKVGSGPLGFLAISYQ